jgi:hypothetical protein
MRVIPPLNEVEDCHAGLGLGLEAAAVEQFAFEGGEETFAHGVVEAVADVVISFHNICCGRSLRSAREMPFLLVEMLIGLEDTRIGRIQTTDSNQAMFEWKYPAQIFCPNSVSC